MGLFYSYKKSGSGVEKDAPKKKGIALYFEIFIRKFWKLLEVNMLYSLFFIPLLLAGYAFFFMTNFYLKMIVMTVGIIAFALVFGPATASVFKIMRSYTLERNSFILTDFKRAFTENYKKSLAMGILNLVVFFSVYAAIRVYPIMVKAYNSKLIYIPMILCISIGIALIFISFYSYLLIVATDVSFKNVIRNSIVLTIVAMKKNIISFIVTILISAVFAVLLIFNLFTLVALIFVPASIIMFTITFNSYPVIQKYVINPYYEQKGEKNPELDDEDIDGEDEDEVVFEDMGGKEKPIDNTKSKNKKKRIS